MKAKGYSADKLLMLLHLFQASSFSESLEGPKEEPYGIGVEQTNVDGDVDGHP